MINTQEKLIFGENKIWFLTGLFYLIGYFVRVQMNACAQNIINCFGLSYGEISILSSAYFISYALIQLPLGIFFSNKTGENNIQAVKLILSISTCVAFVGGLITFLANNFTTIFIGRIISGLGFGCAFVTGMECSRLFYKPKLYTQKLAQFNIFVAIAGILATAPLKAILQYINFSQLSLITCSLLFIISLQAFEEIKDKKYITTNKDILYSPINYKKEITEIIKIFIKDSVLTKMLIVSGLICLPTALTLDLYSFTYFHNVTNMYSENIVSLTSTVTYVISSFIGVFVAIIDRKLKNRTAEICIITLLISLLANIITIYIPINELLFIILVIIGAAAASLNTLLFKYPIQRLPESKISSISSLFNAVIPLFATFGQSLCGFILLTLGQSILTWKIMFLIVPAIFIINMILIYTALVN